MQIDSSLRQRIQVFDTSCTLFYAMPTCVLVWGQLSRLSRYYYHTAWPGGSSESLPREPTHQSALSSKGEVIQSLGK
jgi:hypothetical protein